MAAAITAFFESITALVGGPAIMAIILTVITLIVFAMDKISIGIVAMVSSLLYGLFGCMKMSKVYAGWSSSLTLLLMSMMIVGYSMFETGAVIVVGRIIMKSKAAQNERLMIALIMILSGALSAFLSNTAVVGTFIPLCGAMAAASNGVLKNKHMLMPLGFAAAIGGTLTVVGSTSQPMVNTVLEGAELETLPIFSIFWIALPSFIVTVLWMTTIGYNLMVKVCNFEDVIQNADASTFETFKPTKQTWISIAALAFCVFGFMTQMMKAEIISLIGSIVVLLGGCCSFKNAMTKGVEWNSIFIMAYAQGIAAGMNDSGAGEMIARFFVKLVGDNAMVQMFACVFVITVLTNIMSNTATAAMMMPIYILIAEELGVSYVPFAIAIMVATNLTTATPIGGTAVSMTIQAGYRFNDFVKVGLPLNVLIMLITMGMTAVLYPF